MNEGIPDHQKRIVEILRAKLNLSDSARITRAFAFTDAALPIMPDFIIEDGDKIFVVEVKSRVTIDTIARLNLSKELLQKQTEKKYGGGGGSSGSNLFFVIAGTVIPPREAEIAKKVDIMVVQVPHTIGFVTSNYGTSKKMIKITSDKSWRVISRLLKEKTTSIRQLALMEKVSYGWAYATIQSLINQGIVTKKENYVRISDINKLLNGVAWERPFENLRVGEINIDYDSATRAAEDLSFTLKDQNINFAFTSYTAGGLYTGYAVRHDAIYLYLARDKIDLFVRTFETEAKTGIKALIYAPDRDVFSDKREIESIIITSPSQTLLDLAGLGYSGLDITKAMVENYARI
ncbi:MAG: hypothetical protein EFT35_01820 [Methanophagales archaeon ANME-1-THS]|nr:MAG: hypothetical protein EFT35_01820 [Methanophagales archaeon ANME-1-THS]